jgi:hypothetical protein
MTRRIFMSNIYRILSRVLIISLLTGLLTGLQSVTPFTASADVTPSSSGIPNWGMADLSDGTTATMTGPFIDYNSPSTGKLMMGAKGGKFASTGDVFVYNYIKLTGDFEFSARLVSEANAPGTGSVTLGNNSNAVISVKNHGAGEAAVPTAASPSFNVYYKYNSTAPTVTSYRRTTAGSSSVPGLKATAVPSLPVYLKLSRTGTTFTAQTSIDGNTWTDVVGSYSDDNLANESNTELSVGLGASSGTFVFDNIKVTQGGQTVFDSNAGSSGGGPDSTAPTWTNGSITASNVNQTEMTLNWTGASDDTGVVTYSVYQDAALLGTVSGATYHVTGLTAGTEYTFKVQAGDAAGNWSTNGPMASFTTLSTAAAGPTALTALAGDGNANLIWSSLSGSTYNVKVATSPTGPFTNIATGISLTYYTHNGIINGQTYYYAVTSVVNGVESLDSPIASVTPAAGRIIKNLDVKDNTDMLGNGITRADQWSIAKNLQVGDILFPDRTHKTATIPLEYVGAEWIRTAMDSKGYDGSPLAEFTVGSDAIVMVAMDSRFDGNGATPPSWLSSWSFTEGDVILDDTNPVTFNLYKKMFKAGSIVTLESMNRTAGVAHYFVLALPATVKIDQADGYVKSDSYTVSGVLYAGKSLIISHNGAPLASMDAQASEQSFSYDVTLNEGANKLEFTTTDELGNKSTSFITVTYDVTAPVVTLSPAEIPAEVTKPDYTLLVTVNEDAKLTIKLNGDTVSDAVAVQGGVTVSETISFAEGANTVEMFAEDDAGNVSSIQVFQVTYTFTASDISFKDISGNTVTKLTAGNDIIASLDVTNKTGLSKEVTLMVVLYDTDNTMVMYAYSTSSIASDASKKLNTAIRIPADANGYKIKAFVMDSISGLKALSDAAIVE